MLNANMKTTEVLPQLIQIPPPPRKTIKIVLKTMK